MTRILKQELIGLAIDMDNAHGGTLAYTAPNGMRKNAHDQLMYIIENYLETGPSVGQRLSERPVLLQKRNGEGDLWVYPEDVLRVEDTRAMLPEFNKTVIYFRDGSYRHLTPLTAAEAIAKLWPEPTDTPTTQ